MADKKAEALKIIEQALKELESARGSVTVGLQKLSRAANLLEKKSIYAWAESNLGNKYYINPLKDLFKKIDIEYKATKEAQNLSDSKYSLEMDKLIKTGFSSNYVTEDFLKFKINTEGGGFESIDFIENKLNTLLNTKHGNDDVYYQVPLQKHLAYIKGEARKFAVTLHAKLKFSGTIVSSFDLLKNAVDDKLLDLNPELAEQLMLAFKSVSSDRKEEWSQALTTCRRLLEALADKLYPATDESIGGRTFKQNQYINRLWGFMDKSIASDSNKKLAKAHVDYLGNWLQADYTLTNKGVHAEVTQLEATKTVFHIYLMLADLLTYLDPEHATKNAKPTMNEASLDEIEVLLEVSRPVAKAIWKARLDNKGLTLEQLEKIKGVGEKTLEKAKEVFMW